MLHAVIMAGGSGTRFWPVSRKSQPKQLHRLTGELTMIQETVARCGNWIPAERTWIVTNRLQVEETQRQLPELPAENFLIEPCGRNTAPCIGLAAVRLLQQDPQAVMLVMPSDHVIRPRETFRQAVEQAVQIVEAEPDRFVLFGVPPTYPATGFGYIERGQQYSTDDAGAYRVQSFREKPQRPTAEQYLADGNYYWNCGIFVWKAARILEALREFEPDIHARLMRLSTAGDEGKWEESLEEEFPQMKSISIDYAVLERVVADSPQPSPVCVLEAPFEWDDVGSWQAIPRLVGQDDDGNTVVGTHCGVETRNCIVRSDGDHLIATIGLKDCIIVHTADATLVARKDDEQAIKELVIRLEDEGYERFL